jgi:hypothetical protein
MARHSYDRWLITGGKDTRSPAIMHAYHTHPSAWHRHSPLTPLADLNHQYVKR